MKEVAVEVFLGRDKRTCIGIVRMSQQLCVEDNPIDAEAC